MLSLSPTEPAAAVPRGGRRGWLPSEPAFSLLFRPHSPAPLPGGKGENHSFLMQGASPLASPELNGARHWLSLRCRKPKGGAAILVACLHCHCGTRRGAQGFWLPADLAFSLLSCPHPPNPLPGGKGGDLRLFYARGSAPCIPGAVPTVRRENGRRRFPTSSAGSQGEGGPGERNFGV